MLRSVRMRLGTVVVVVICAVGLGATPARADEGWSCSPPPRGYTYIGIQQLSGVCGSPWPAFRYDVKLPEDGLLACALVEGWAFTNSRSSVNRCAITGTAFQLRLAKPVTGLWSCNIPKGWTYSRQQLATNVCGNGTFSMFQLAPL